MCYTNTADIATLLPLSVLQTFDERYVAEWVNLEANCLKSNAVLTHHLGITSELGHDLFTQMGANKDEPLVICGEVVTDGFKKGIKSLLKRIYSSISSIEAQIEAAVMSSDNRGFENMATEEHLAVEPVAEEHLAVEHLAVEHLPQLPWEMIEEVFARFPIESLLRFRTTCKVFYDKTFEVEYIYRHLDLSKERFFRFDNRLHIIDPVAMSDWAGVLPPYHEPADFIHSAVHCDGLFLFQHRYLFELALWNPFLRHIYWIDPMGNLTNDETYGIGYCPDKRRCYKIVRIYDAVCEDQVQVFDTSTKKWTIVHASSPRDWRISRVHPGLSINGNMFWLARSKAHPVPTFIHSFDFSADTFTLVCTLPLIYDTLHTNALSVYNHNRLSLLHQSRSTSVINVWVTTPLAEEAVTWSLFFTVANQDIPCIRPCYDVAYPVHFLDRNNTLVLLCRVRTEEVGEDNDDELNKGSPQIILYRFGRHGIQERANVAEAVFFEHHVCGYLYTPSLVWLD